MFNKFPILIISNTIIVVFIEGNVILIICFILPNQSTFAASFNSKSIDVIAANLSIAKQKNLKFILTNAIFNLLVIFINHN